VQQYSNTDAATDLVDLEQLGLPIYIPAVEHDTLDIETAHPVVREQKHGAAGHKHGPALAMIWSHKPVL
jgi:hypothetical protein